MPTIFTFHHARFGLITALCSQQEPLQRSCLYIAVVGHLVFSCFTDKDDTGGHNNNVDVDDRHQQTMRSAGSVQYVPTAPPNGSEQEKLSGNQPLLTRSNTEEDPFTCVH